MKKGHPKMGGYYYAQESANQWRGINNKRIDIDALSWITISAKIPSYRTVKHRKSGIEHCLVAECCENATTGN
jgi:hypothetical protein